MDFALPPHVELYRQRLKRLIAEHVTPEVTERQHRTGTFNSYELNRALAREGYLERAVPGLGKGDPVELWVLFNELEKAGAPFDSLSNVIMIAGVVAHVGTDWQKENVLPSMLTGEALVSLGYSEPDYGSDVASIVTRAVRDGDEWVVNGAKMWTTMAHEATWLLLLTRTNTDVPKHKGLTMFIMPMKSPGITVEPVHTMGTERTNATFYDNVRIDDRWRIGDVDGGWRVMAVALSFERRAGILDDAVVRERVARIAIDNEVSQLLSQRGAWIAATGGLPGLEGSMTKIFSSESYQKAARWMQQAAGAEGLLQFHERGAAANGFIDYDARHAPVVTIYGGTSEINRNNIAERHLGLPKTR
jgi:alkylation response protein AidB-like acyl-CoA dehydrogenase